MQYIVGVSFMSGEIAKADIDPLVVQLDSIDRRNLEQTMARAKRVLKFKRKSEVHRAVRPMRSPVLLLRSEIQIGPTARLPF